MSETASQAAEWRRQSFHRVTARSFVQSVGGVHRNEVVVATKGTTLVTITATATPASLSQMESLVNQLL